jgi:hypothetical protein
MYQDSKGSGAEVGYGVQNTRYSGYNAAKRCLSLWDDTRP